MTKFDWVLIGIAAIQTVRILVGLFTMHPTVYKSDAAVQRALRIASKHACIWVLVPILIVIYRVYG